MARRNRRPRGESRFRGRILGNRAEDGERLNAVAEQPRVTFEAKRVEGHGSPAAKPEIDERGRRHVADFEADITSQTKAQIVLAEQRALGALKRLRFVRIDPRNERQRLAGKLRIVGQLGGTSLGAFGAPGWRGARRSGERMALRTDRPSRSMRKRPLP